MEIPYHDVTKRGYYIPLHEKKWQTRLYILSFPLTHIYTLSCFFFLSSYFISYFSLSQYFTLVVLWGYQGYTHLCSRMRVHAQDQNSGLQTCNACNICPLSVEPPLQPYFLSSFIYGHTEWFFAFHTENNVAITQQHTHICLY